MNIRRTVIIALFTALCSMGFTWYALRPQIPAPVMAVVTRPYDIPSLQQMTAGAETDEQATSMIVAWFDVNHELLSQQLQADGDRLTALFVMTVVNNAQPYNLVEHDPVTLLDFVASDAAHCGTYAIAQSRIMAAFGIEHRIAYLDGAIDGPHAAVEAMIDGHWETFDATSNVWLSVSMHDVMSGAPHETRAYYLPALDPSAPERFRAFEDGMSQLELRTDEAFFGQRIFLSVSY